MSTAFPQEFSESDGDLAWRTCRFKISWPPDAEVDWAVDLLLAHAVVGPVLREHAGNLPWWRFHRRALRDSTGHQFSFLFYSNPRVAADVMADIRMSQILQQALADNILEAIIFDDPEEPGRPEIEATSDPRWSPSLQRNWPSYIMGVSSLWLGLIEDTMADESINDDDLSEQLDTYRKAEVAINAIWHEEGQHAFLHHLNAMFGYEPLQIKKDTRF
jgi:hypothetical protein